MITGTMVFAGRATRRYLRSPESIISTIGFPVLLLLTLLAVFGTAVEAFEVGDGPYAQRLVPTLVVSGLLFGSVNTAVGFFTDLQDGFMDRVRTLPVPSIAPLAGAVVSEVARAMTAVLVLVAVGYAFGFRFDNGVGPTIGFVAVAALAAVSVVWIGLALATVASSQEALSPPLSALFLLLLFFSQGMVPLDAYPDWATPIVRFNPATSFVVALDRLARGGELVGPILGSLGWAVGLMAVFGTIATRAVRRKR
ncbi:MAG: ABC transporter permease [Actinomycetota bacterium]